jgi:hypothetical protein
MIISVCFCVVRTRSDWLTMQISQLTESPWVITSLTESTKAYRKSWAGFWLSRGHIVARTPISLSPDDSWDLDCLNDAPGLPINGRTTENISTRISDCVCRTFRCPIRKKCWFNPPHDRCRLWRDILPSNWLTVVRDANEKLGFRFHQAICGRPRLA